MIVVKRFTECSFAQICPNISAPNWQALPRFMRQEHYDRNFSKKKDALDDHIPMSPVVSMSSVSNISSVASFDPRRQGAVIHSVTTPREHRVHFGVQSATFVRTVFPGQVSGTYRISGMIPTWRGPQITANFTPSGSRSAGAPPVPFPPRNASAFYSPPQGRIIPNPFCKTCR